MCIGISGATTCRRRSLLCVGASQAPATLRSHQTRNTLGKNTKELRIMGMLLSKKPPSLCALFV